MNLSYSYWEKKQFFNYDAIIIGSGIVGLNAAIELKKLHPTFKIAVLEAGFLPTGASTKNAGFACFGSVSELIEQENNLGTLALYNLVKKRWDGLKKLRSLLGDNNIDYKNEGGYELFKDFELEKSKKSIEKIDHFNSLIKDITGVSNTFELDNSEIKQFGFKGISTLIKNNCEASIDTGKMMFQLILLAKAHQISIFNNCKVEKIQQNEVDCDLLTNHGQFKANKVLVCTNAFTKSLLPKLNVVPGRGQVIVTKPIKNLKIKGTFHYDDGFYYFRNIDHRILLGGGRNIDFENETTTVFSNTSKIITALETLLSEIIIPDIPFEIEHQWSGIMAFGDKIDPIIEQISPSVYCAVRCNGMGVAIGSQTGADLAHLVNKHI